MERKFQIGVKALITNESGDVLLLKSNDKNFRFAGKSYWDMPGGRIKYKGIEETLKQEILEETGIKKMKSPL